MKMRKLTVRVDDYIYNRLMLVSEEESKSVNKIINLILKKEIDKPKEYNFLNEIDKRLNVIDEKISSISKRQYLHFKVSLQHFVNEGYFENANVENDKCYKKLLERTKDKFNA